jgi:CcmD family protein
MEEGKLFVVIAVLTIILVGIGLYLFNLDRKISALHKKVENEFTGKSKN